jgi:hypothetical protein
LTKAPLLVESASTSSAIPSWFRRETASGHLGSRGAPGFGAAGPLDYQASRFSRSHSPRKSAGRRAYASRPGSWHAPEHTPSSGHRRGRVCERAVERLSVPSSPGPACWSLGAGPVSRDQRSAEPLGNVPSVTGLPQHFRRFLPNGQQNLHLFPAGNSGFDLGFRMHSALVLNLHCTEPGRGVEMTTIVIVLLVLFLLGGGGWGYSRWRG